MKGLVIVAAILASAYADAECEQDTDCPAYHWCHSTYEGIGRFVGSECKSNLDETFGPPCNGEHSICQANDPRITSGNPGDSTGMCFNIDGNEACRQSYFMPCSSDSDCADGFGCRQTNFSNGPANACQPLKEYTGAPRPCSKVQDCGFSTYFGYKWMPCHGRCATIVA